MSIYDYLDLSNPIILILFAIVIVAEIGLALYLIHFSLYWMNKQRLLLKLEQNKKNEKKAKMSGDNKK